MHQLTLTFQSMAELQAAVAKLAGAAGKSDNAPNQAQAANSSRTATGTGADAQSNKAENSKPVETPEDDPFGDAGTPVTFDSLVNSLREYSKKEGVSKEAFGALLKKHGASKVPELQAKGEATWRAILKEIGA